VFCKQWKRRKFAFLEFFDGQTTQHSTQVMLSFAETAFFFFFRVQHAGKCKLACFQNCRAFLHRQASLEQSMTTPSVAKTLAISTLLSILYTNWLAWKF
jgi:hypothetical protein